MIIGFYFLLVCLSCVQNNQKSYWPIGLKILLWVACRPANNPLDFGDYRGSSWGSSKGNPIVKYRDFGQLPCNLAATISNEMQPNLVHRRVGAMTFEIGLKVNQMSRTRSQRSSKCMSVQHCPGGGLRSSGRFSLK